MPLSLILILGFISVIAAFTMGWILARRTYHHPHLPKDKELINFMIDSVYRLPDGVARFDKE